MTRILELFKKSEFWYPSFDLPLFPMYDNPWIYGAYALKILRQNGISPEEDRALVEAFEAYADKCGVRDTALGGTPIPGLFHRWPSGQSTVFSHDEIMGMAYISPRLAEVVLEYLEKHDGFYCDRPNEVADPLSEKYNVFRMIWLKPFLQASTKTRRLGLASQAIWSSSTVLDALRFRRGDTADAGGRLRTWIMLDAMEKYPVAGFAVLAWRAAMRAKGATLNKMLAIEPGKDYPELAQYAKEDF